LEGFLAWLRQLQFGGLLEMLITVASCLVCITFHEMSHGYAAWLMGDPTARRAGRLTLNPLKHIDFFGLVMLAVAKFGWAKPVPVNMRNFREPKLGMALTALAGPVSNVLLAWIATMLYYGVGTFAVAYDSAILSYIHMFFLYTALLSTGLAVFNLFPIPPLDGSKVLFALLPESWYGKLMRYERYGMILLITLLMGNILDPPLNFLRDGLLQIIDSASRWVVSALLFLFF